jgi:hypothetical protein
MDAVLMVVQLVSVKEVALIVVHHHQAQLGHLVLLALVETCLTVMGAA